MPLPVYNTLEGGSNGTTVSAANSGGVSGTALDDIATVTAGTLTFDNAVQLAGHGALSLKAATGATAGSSYAGWTNTTTGTTTGDFSGRFYFRPGTLATFTTCRIFACNSASGVIAFTLFYTRATNVININDTAGTNIGSLAAISQNTWYRIEFQCTPSTTVGQVVLRAYLTNSNTLSTSVDTGATRNLGGTGHFGNDRFGISGTAVASAGPFYYDDMTVQAGLAWIGPAGYRAPSVRAAQAVNRAASF